ncbi:hypothetical protein SAMN05660841_03725 [Sphingobacterium nematocida]|uniref:Uncharacterized protein n=1 Tax=Sphingobacterium nematocida TaxID=1513896 RepID=A0A1T5G3Q2_9SPHI|nr:hypothetical protein [Sphingobacterium nematocida]SKC02972.1 hypothetical protein SAMN05660841_03725 [Sphingobacterium nematocida]
MKNIAQKIRPWFRKVKDSLLKGSSNTYRDPKRTEAETKLDQFRQAAINAVDMPNDYLDRHLYWRMDPLDKKTPKDLPIQSFPKKDVYKCFGWQLHPYDIQKLSEYIDANPRLERIQTNSIIAGASEADILILTSGSGKYHIDSFLSDIDTSNKIVIIASVRELDSIKQDINHRIDAHFNKLKPFSIADFNTLIDEVILTAQAEQPEENTSKKRLKTSRTDQIRL